jgi:mRNA-degrading endonuclease RelE of RelBE toxin-antitoxin system
VPNSETQPRRESIVSRSILIPPSVWDELDSFDKNLKTKFIRAFKLISRNLGHPSLHIEIIKAQNTSFYRARVDPSHRIHFELKDHYYAILAVGSHRLQGIG